MVVKVEGVAEIIGALREIGEALDKSDPITGQLVSDMEKFVHRRTGYLASTFYQKTAVAGADAPYAGYEEERGGEHAYATQAIEDFDTEKYIDELVEAW